MTTPKTGYTREGFLQLLHERLAAAHLAGLDREGFPASSLKLLEHYFEQIAAPTAPAGGEAPVAYIWHQHLGEKTKSLRWTKPTQWEYAERVEPLYTHPSADLRGAAEQALEALRKIRDRCPPYTGCYTLESAPSDFGNAEDYAYERELMISAATGNIAAAAIASLEAAISRTENRPDDVTASDAPIPVAEVRIEPDYWSRGHFYEGRRKALFSIADIEALPLGTKLYAAGAETCAGSCCDCGKGCISTPAALDAGNTGTDGGEVLDTKPALHACASIENYLRDRENHPFPSGALSVLRWFIKDASGMPGRDGGQQG